MCIIIGTSVARGLFVPSKLNFLDMNSYTAWSLNNWTFRLFTEYQPFAVFSFAILGNPEQRKLEFFYTAFLSL